MKKIDSWLDIQRYVSGAAQAAVLAPETEADIEFLARVLPTQRTDRRERRFRRARR